METISGALVTTAAHAPSCISDLIDSQCLDVEQSEFPLPGENVEVVKRRLLVFEAQGLQLTLEQREVQDILNIEMFITFPILANRHDRLRGLSGSSQFSH
jgi:hypothetical protein